MAHPANGRHVAVIVVVLGVALAGRASSSCSAPPASARCVAWGHDTRTSVQAPVAVDLCVAAEVAATLTFQDHDGNTLGTLAVSGDRLQARDAAGEEKDSRKVPASALQEGRLHLRIHHDTTTHDMRVLTREGTVLLDIPVGKTASLRVTLQHQHGHDAMRCSPTTTTTTPSVSATTTSRTSLRGSNETSVAADPENWTSKEVVVVLGVGAGLAGVAVVLSLAMLGLTLALQR